MNIAKVKRRNNFVQFIGIICLGMGCSAAHAEVPKDCVFLISGTCFNCDTPYTLELGTKENCLHHCPNRFYFEGEYHNTCDFKEDTKFNFPPVFFDRTQVPLEKCAEKEGYFYGIHDENCYSCDTTTPVWMDPKCEQKDECLYRCPNRILQYTSPTTTISVLKCPPDRPLMDRFFACWRCDEPTPLDMSFNQEKILGAKYNRQGVVCQGQRYFKKDEILSYPCPQDKKTLSEEACRQCNGKWLDNVCS